MTIHLQFIVIIKIEEKAILKQYNVLYILTDNDYYININSIVNGSDFTFLHYVKFEEVAWMMKFSKELWR